MNSSANIPEGTRDRLFSECLDRREVQERLTEAFGRWGYAEIITPEVEFYDLFLRSGNPLPQESMLKIIDRSGKIMVMRPDCTTPIARVAATKLKAVPLPQRLYYNQTVFRSDSAHRGGSSEIAQCGVELIGASGRKADVEMIAAAIDALCACGLDGRFHLELGHVGFFRELTARMELPCDEAERMRALIESKNFAALGDCLAPYRSRPGAAALGRLSQLFGGAEALGEARALAGKSQSLDYLEELYHTLEQAGLGRWLRFDLGLVHQIDYYTGVVFRGYVEGAGDAVLSGGRYDTLVGAFGREAPATGFAIDVDAVAACLPRAQPPRVERVIHFEEADFAFAVQGLRDATGLCELSLCATLEETLALAREKGAREVAVVAGGAWKEVISL